MGGSSANRARTTRDCAYPALGDADQPPGVDVELGAVEAAEPANRLEAGPPEERGVSAAL
jgi:hypothetical protein